MPPEISMVADLANILSEGLGEPFVVLPAKSYVAVLHPDLGLAAVIPSDKEQLAQHAANDLTTMAALAGVAWPAVYFGVSPTRVAPPWLLRAGAGTVVDMISTMKLQSAARPQLGADGVTKVADQLLKAQSAAVTVSTAPIHGGGKLSDEFVKMMRACAEKALAGRPAFLAGVDIDADDFASPSFLLPAILVSAAQKWIFPVVAKKGQGGFLIRMERDSKAVLGYKVNSVQFASPLLLFLPTVKAIKGSIKNGECVMDGVVQEFSDYLDRNGLDNSDLVDVEVSTTTR